MNKSKPKARVMVAAHVPTSIIDELDKIAQQEEVNRAVVVRWAINRYLESRKTPKAAKA